MANKTLKVSVRSRQGLVFDGDLKAVSSVNKMGPFDILPEHANFVTVISKKVTLHKLDGQQQEIPLNNGVILVENNEVKVFLGVSKI